MFPVVSRFKEQEPRPEIDLRSILQSQVCAVSDKAVSQKQVSSKKTKGSI